MNKCPECGNYNDFMDRTCGVCGFCFRCGENPCRCPDVCGEWDEWVDLDNPYDLSDCYPAGV